MALLFPCLMDWSWLYQKKKCFLPAVYVSQKLPPPPVSSQLTWPQWSILQYPEGPTTEMELSLNTFIGSAYRSPFDNRLAAEILYSQKWLCCLGLVTDSFRHQWGVLDVMYQALHILGPTYLKNNLSLYETEPQLCSSGHLLSVVSPTMPYLATTCVRTFSGVAFGKLNISHSASRQPVKLNWF